MNPDVFAGSVCVSQHPSICPPVHVPWTKHCTGTHCIFFNLLLQLCLTLPLLVHIFLHAILLVKVHILDTTPFAHYLISQTLLPLCWRLRPERVVNDFDGCSGA